MFGIGRFEELVVVLAIILVLFGGKKLPELSKGLGESIKEIRKGFTSDVSEKKSERKEESHDNQHTSHDNQTI